MSAKQSSAVVMGSDKNIGRGQAIRKLLSMPRAFVPLVFLLALIGGGIYLWLIHSPQKKPAAISSADRQVVDQAVYGTVQNPNYAAAKQILTNQIHATPDEKKQSQLYSQLAVLELKQNNNQQAIDDQLKAQELDPALADAQSRVIADEYLALGNKSKALDYYKKALAYYQSQPDSYSGKTYFVNDLTAKIAELEK